MKFNEGDYAVIVSEAEDMKKFKGELVKIIEILPKVNANDYVIELLSKDFNSTNYKVREVELKVANVNLLNMQIGDEISYSPSQEIGYVNKIDYLYDQIGVSFKDGSSIVVNVPNEIIIKKRRNNHRVKEHTNYEILIKHYKNNDGTYTIPKHLLINLINAAVGV